MISVTADDEFFIRDCAVILECVSYPPRRHYSIPLPSGVTLVLMHSRGRPETMIDEAVYGDVVAETTAELRMTIGRAVEAGVPEERIIVDPGIGFAKRAAHSYGVLARLPAFAAALDRPVL